MEHANRRPMLLGSMQHACYIETKVKAYEGNPLIEALPPLWEDIEAMELLVRTPEYEESERLLPSVQRIHSAHSQLLNFFFQPLPVHCDLESRLSRLVRQGYIGRNPLGIDRIKELNRIRKQLLQVGQYELPKDLSHTAASFSIIGPSGVGKTMGIERILLLYPQLIIHEQEIELYQIVWLKLDCPFDGSLGGLCRRFFETVDEILGTNYRSKFASSRMPLDAMIHHMAQLAALHCIGVLVIDEIQHLSMAKSGGAEKMLNFFVTLINTIGIPVVLVGTMGALPVLQNDFRQARRGTGVGCLVWEALEPGVQWDILMDSMWKYQWTKMEFPCTEEMKALFYEESQGIVDVAVKLFLLSQLRAIAHRIEIVTTELVIDTAKEHFKLMKPMLEALKTKNPHELAKYPDMQPLDITEAIARYKNVSILKEKTKKNLSQRSSWDSKCSKFLLNRGFEEAVIIKALQQTSSQKNGFSLYEEWENLVLQCCATLKAAMVEGNSKKERRKKENAGTEPGILLQLYAKRNNKSSYEVLNENGYIKGPLSEFSW